MSQSASPAPYNGQSNSGASTPQSHPSLPARPPAASFGNSAPNSSSGYGNRGGNSYLSFKPRSVGGPQTGTATSWQTPSMQPYVTAPASNYAQPNSYQYSQSGYQGQPYGAASYAQAANPPQIQNPFPAPQAQSSYYGGQQQSPTFDPAEQAQIAQWQTAYMTTDVSTNKKSGGTSAPASSASKGPVASAASILRDPNYVNPYTGLRSTNPSTINNENNSVAKPSVEETVIRTGGGQTWEDPSLLEWDDNHFRLFVGNLAGEVTDDSLAKAFSRYSSLAKAKVLRDKRTTKSRGYGFVSFADGDEYFQAFKEMQGKYIGSHPVLLKKANSNVKSSFKSTKHDYRYKKKDVKPKNKAANEQGKNVLAPTPGQGITKKAPKTKGGMKLLG